MVNLVGKLSGIGKSLGNEIKRTLKTATKVVKYGVMLPLAIESVALPMFRAGAELLYAQEAGKSYGVKKFSEDPSKGIGKVIYKEIFTDQTGKEYYVFASPLSRAFKINAEQLTNPRASFGALDLIDSKGNPYELWAKLDLNSRQLEYYVPVGIGDDIWNKRLNVTAIGIESDGQGSREVPIAGMNFILPNPEDIIKWESDYKEILEMKDRLIDLLDYARILSDKINEAKIKGLESRLSDLKKYSDNLWNDYSKLSDQYWTLLEKYEHSRPTISLGILAGANRQGITADANIPLSTSLALNIGGIAQRGESNSNTKYGFDSGNERYVEVTTERVLNDIIGGATLGLNYRIHLGGQAYFFVGGKLIGGIESNKITQKVTTNEFDANENLTEPPQINIEQENKLNPKLGWGIPLGLQFNLGDQFRLEVGPEVTNGDIMVKTKLGFKLK